MHFFLTGERGVGKSQALRQAVTLSELPPFGFVTRFMDSGDGFFPSLYMMPPSWSGPAEDGYRIAVRREGRMVLLPEQFDSLSTALLREARTHPEGVILMDECGHLEKDRLPFHREIARCLDQDVPVLGVLRLNQPWHSFIIHHPKVRVITVTPENRDSLPGWISEHLKRERNPEE